MPKKMRIVTASNLIAFGQLVTLLQDGTRTCAELAEETGLNKLTVYRYCAAIYRAGGAHIAGWEMDARGGFTIRVFKLGPGKDAPSKPRSRARQSQQHRRRNKTNAIAHAIAGEGATTCPA